MASFNMTARIAYTELTDAAGQPTWSARISLNGPYPGMQQVYSQLQAGIADRDRPLADSWTVRGSSLEDARSSATASIATLTGLEAFSTRFVDLREYHAQPAAFEEFKVAKQQRKAA